MKTLKRGLLILLTLVMVLSCLTVPALADEDVGDPNISGDDGGTGAGSESAYWGAYLQGVRISVYDIKGKRVKATADYSNLTNEQIKGAYCGEDMSENWFGYTDKTAYMKGRSLTPSFDAYSVRNFRQNGKVVTFPNCINSNDTTNFAAVKEFMTRKETIEGLANDFNMSFEEITSENIKIIIEPVVFMKYDWQWYCFTATEAALFEETYGRMVSSSTTTGMTSLTERTLPLSTFLEKDDPDVGITAYKGNNQAQSTSVIKAQLGVGIISFADEKEAEICCDCDQWCPCKFYDDGTKKTGDCRCFDPNDRQRHGHPNRIPCTPTYPDNCLCQLGTIKVKKVDSSNNRALSGASFLIVNNWTGQQLTGTTGSDGYVTFDKVHMGEWVVIESQSPSGYVASGNPQKLTLQPGGNKTVTVTVKNEKIPDPPPFEYTDNTIWASELTRSFTNETNFDKIANWPTLHTPPNYGGPLDLGFDISLAGGTLTVTEHTNEHIKYAFWDKNITVKRQAYLDRGTLFAAADRQYGTMNRYRIMHRGSDSIIESIMNTLINVLSHVVDVDVLQDYMLRFEEQNGEYTIQRETDIFKELKHKTWVSHRNGGLSSQSQEIPLAKYMGKTLENKLYKAYYTFYTGFDASEANTNTRGNATYASIGEITTYTTHAGTANDMERDYTATGCRGSNMDGTDTVDASFADLGIISSTLTASTPRQQYKYSVEGTYRAKDRTADTGKSQQLHEEGTHNGKTYINQIFEAPSNTFTFYPTYKMYYSSELGKQPNSTAWMLSAGRRTYRATDVIKIEVTGGDTDVWAPWSRDWQDKYTEDSVWGMETDRGYSVIKSGMVVRAVASPIQIRITGAFSIQDPDFAPDGMQSAVAAMNANKEAEMTKAVNKIADDLTPSAMAGEGMSYGFYSNLWEATSENVVAAYAFNPLVKVDFDGSKILNYYHSESPKTRLNIANSDASDYSRTEYYAQHRLSTDLLPTEGILGSIFGTLTGEKLVNDITINGHNYPVTSGISLLEKYTNASDTLCSLLDTSSGISLKHNVGSEARSSGPRANWYEEFYDGIRMCEYTVTISINKDGALSTDYVQVHSQLSDDVTPLNEFAEEFQNPAYLDEVLHPTSFLSLFTAKTKVLIPEGMYGIGLCAIQPVSTDITFGGTTFQNGSIFWPAKQFGVRGSVYDLAQNAPQYLLNPYDYPELPI